MQELDVSGYMSLIGPTPLLMIVSKYDTTTPTDISLDHFHAVTGPKKLIVLDSNHYGAYVEKFDETSAAARDWFINSL